MRITTYLKSLFVAGLSVFILSGCSSGSSASGLGLGISGFWAGTLFRNGAAYTNFTMSLVQIQDDDDGDTNSFPTSTLEGILNSNDKCIAGGKISGTINANNVIIDVEMSTGTLSMAGSASSSSSMTGSWSSSTGGEGEEGAADCNLSGTWTAGR